MCCILTLRYGMAMILHTAIQFYCFDIHLCKVIPSHGEYNGKVMFMCISPFTFILRKHLTNAENVPPTFDVHSFFVWIEWTILYITFITQVLCWNVYFVILTIYCLFFIVRGVSFGGLLVSSYKLHATN